MYYKKLRDSLYDDEFRKIWESRNILPVKNQLENIGIKYNEMTVHSVADCVIFYDCEVSKDLPKFLDIVC